MRTLVQDKTRMASSAASLRPTAETTRASSASSKKATPDAGTANLLVMQTMCQRLPAVLDSIVGNHLECPCEPCTRAWSGITLMAADGIDWQKRGEGSGDEPSPTGDGGPLSELVSAFSRLSQLVHLPYLARSLRKDGAHCSYPKGLRKDAVFNTVCEMLLRDSRPETMPADTIGPTTMCNIASDKTLSQAEMSMQAGLVACAQLLAAEGDPDDFNGLLFDVHKTARTVTHDWTQANSTPLGQFVGHAQE